MSLDPQGDVCTVDQILDSTLESVDSAELLVTDLARAAGFGEDDLMGISLAVRECLVNAVKHGNRFSEQKKVRFEVWQAPRRIKVKIGDEGNGFRLEDVPDPLAEENLMRGSGRGLFLIRAFMDEFSVRDIEPHGTEVTLVKAMSNGQPAG
jgi:serine/threonine-protein kinase RsbW